MVKYLIPLFLSLVLLWMCLPALADDHVIQPGDSIIVTVLDEANLSKQAVVTSEGTITLPLVKEIKVSGLTPSQAAEQITARLKSFIKNPQVTVEVIEAAKMPITVMGEVQKPGVCMLPPGAKLVDAITAAGGYTPNADLSRVKVSRAGDAGGSTTVDLNKFLLSGDASVNLTLSTQDTVVVPTLETVVTGSVMVLGAVRQSGQHPLTPGMTLREAVMLAGGPTELADLTNVTLRHEGSTEQINIDFTRTAAGDVIANPVLKPGDVIFVAAREQLGFYTIQGAVARPGEYEIKGRTTLTEAIAIAGGVADRGKLSDVRVLRSSGETPQTIKANVSDIMAGKAQNVEVQDGDSILVASAKEKPDYLRMLSIVISLAWLLTRN